MKHILSLIITFIACLSVWGQNPYEKYEKLYEGCVDGKESTIYGGTYGSWPPEMNVPEFPNGGDVEFTRFIYENLTYPEVVESYDSLNNPVLAKGTVAVQIVIDRCGRATRQEIIQSVNEAYDEEAMRIMNGLPVFKPADYKGVRVKCALIVPVNFMRDKMPRQPEGDIIEFDENYNFDDW